MSKITYHINVMTDETPVRGNAICTGDKDDDRAYENSIFERLNAGDIWAWCVVEVVAEITIDGATFSGSDYLGGCNYLDEDDFRENSGYYGDMKVLAVQDLKQKLIDAREEGVAAQKAINLILGKEQGQ